jgi:hypothetical protein
MLQAYCILRARLLTILKSIDVARSCAKDDPGQWNAVLEAMPCVKALIADVVAASLEPVNANVKEITFDIRPSGSKQSTSASQAFQRTTSARSARLQRRAIVAGLTANRDVQRFDADKGTARSHQEPSDARPKVDPQFSFTRVVKNASPSSKREVTGRPKWQPTTCTAPGVTCGTAGQSGPVSKNEMRRDSRCDTESSSLRLDTRDAQPSPKLPKRFPLLCTTFGIACGDSSTPNDGAKDVDSGQASDITAKREAQPSGKRPKWFPLLCGAPGITCAKSATSNEGSKNDHVNQRTNSTAKREARPVPVAEARPIPQKAPPKWQPTACTVRGMTCGHVNGVAAGAMEKNVGDDGAKPAIEHSGTGEHIKQREPDAAAQVWPGAGRSIFTDDEGDVVQIEENSAFAT